MSSFTDGRRKTFNPNGTVDLSAKQFYIVKETAANTVDLASAATDFIVGTINNLDRKGQEVEVVLRNGSGTHKVIVGTGPVAVGDALTSDASGKAVVTTTGADQILGYAAQTGATGDIIEYYLAGFVKVR